MTLLVTAGISQTYGPEIFGQYSYVTAIVLFIAPLLYSGIEPVLIKKLVEHKPESAHEIICSAFALIAGLTAISLALPLSYVYFIEPSNKGLLMLALALSVSYVPQAFFVLMAFFKVQEQTLLVASASLASLVVSNSIKLVFIWYKLPLLYVLLCSSVETVGVAIILGVAYWRTSRTTARPSLHVVMKLLFDSWQTILSSLVILLLFRYTHLYLAKASSVVELGLYAIAFQLFNVLNAVPQAFFSANFAKMSQLSNSDAQAYIKYCINTLHRFTKLGIILCAGSFLCSGFVIPLIFGTAYQAASLVFNLLSIAAIFTYSAAVRGQVIHLSHPQHLHVVNALLGLAILIPLNIVLVPRFGALGAAISVTVSCFVSGVASSFLYAPLRPFGTEQLRAMVGLRGPDNRF